MPVIFQKGTEQQPSNTLVVGSGLNLTQTTEGLPELSSTGAASGEAVVSPSGSDDTTAIRNAMSANARVRLAPGVFTVSGIIDVPAGKVVGGTGMDKTTINKTNYVGAVFRFGDTTEYAAVENLRIVGPGKAVGSGNTGIVAARGGGLAVARRLRFRNLHIEELTDYGIHLDKCGLVQIENCIMNKIGFNGIYATGASTGAKNSAAIQIANVRVLASGSGIYVRYSDGVVLAACEVDGCWGSYRLDAVNDAAIIACISRKCEQIALLVTGGSNVGVESFSSDNVGTPYFADYPHLKVDGSATGVRVNGFRRINTDQPGTITWEADVAAAGARVLVGYHDFTTGKINSGGKFSDVTATPVP